MSTTFRGGLLVSLTYSLFPALSFAQSSSANFQNSSELDEIIVTGSPLARSVNDTITGISVLTGDELADRLASTIGETLKSEPGISSTFFGAGASRPIVRGQDGDRIRVLTNGVGSIDASSASPDHAVAAEPAQAERIEVVRGASILRFGSSGSGGIVNILDGRIPQSVPEDGFDGAFRISGTTVDNGFEGAGAIDAALGISSASLFITSILITVFRADMKKVKRVKKKAKKRKKKSSSQSVLTNFVWILMAV